MKYILYALTIVALSGCAGVSGPDGLQKSDPLENPVPCPGTVTLAQEYAGIFEPVDDQALLSSALGVPKAGKLCQGKVYLTQKALPIYRAWNSTNPNSQSGNWWAFDKPAGKMSQYRYDYEICYQWSPLDKLSHCSLSAGSKVVIGTGQSAECSSYLTYPASETLQVFIQDAASSISGCVEYDALFNWQPVIK